VSIQQEGTGGCSELLRDVAGKGLSETGEEGNKIVDNEE
jgi:hypothetical protein